MARHEVPSRLLFLYICTPLAICSVARNSHYIEHTTVKMWGRICLACKSADPFRQIGYANLPLFRQISHESYKPEPNNYINIPDPPQIRFFCAIFFRIKIPINKNLLFEILLKTNLGPCSVIFGIAQKCHVGKTIQVSRDMLVNLAAAVSPS